MNRATDDLISRAEAKDFVRSERGAELLKHFPLNAIIVLKLLDEIPTASVAQEPVVLSLNDVRLLLDNTVIWLENNDKPDVIPGIVNHVWNGLPNMVSFTVANMQEIKADMLWYETKWRCWTSHPTAEQRKAIKWKT